MILTSRYGNVEVRSAGEWPGFQFGANPLTVPPPGWRSGVDRGAVSGIPAADACVRIASEGVAGMEPGVFRGDGLDRLEVNTTWQARFFNGQPNDEEPWNTVWQQTEASLTAERNGYWWLTLDNMARVAAVQVIDPCLVTPKREYGVKVFDVQQKGGRITVGSDRILHFKGMSRPGAVAAENPVTLFCNTFGASIHRTSYEEEFYERGLGQAIAVTFPQGVNLQDARAIQEAMLQSHGGAGNQHKPRVFGGGAQITTIGISPRDAQFIEGMNLTVEEVSRIYGVPQSLLGGSSAKGDATPLSPEHEMTRWLRYGLSPRLSRIAAAINHHPAFFGAGSRDSFAWETGDAVVGDVATEDLIAHQQIQDGRITVNEWRATKGLPPLTGGDVPQITPVGGAPNPGAAVIPTGGLEPATEPAAELET
jgi:HK97 family phage portal protein